MNALPPSTVQRIASGQVITSVSSAVKELVENSLDAGSSSVIVKLENYGLDLIEVRDNGCGISASEACHAALAHYTSKLRTQEDLLQVRSYGFRGEALSSLCCVADVKITSRTAQQDVAQQYTLDKQGHVLANKPSAGDVGTTVSASGIFVTLPVRRQVFKNARRCKDELREVEDRLMALALAVPNVRLQLIHNKQTIWQRPGGGDFTAAAVAVFGSSVFSQLKLHYHNASVAGESSSTKEIQLHVTALLPKPLASVSSVLRSASNRSFVIINNRPVDHPALHKRVRQAVVSALHSVSATLPSQASKNHPVYCMLLQIPTHVVDVNINPAKSAVMIDEETLLLDEVDKLLDAAYPSVDDPAMRPHNTVSVYAAASQKPAAAQQGTSPTRKPVTSAILHGDVDTTSMDPSRDGASSKTSVHDKLSEFVDFVDDDDLLLEEGVFGAEGSFATPSRSSGGDTDDVRTSTSVADGSQLVATPPCSFLHASALISQPSATEDFTTTPFSSTAQPTAMLGSPESVSEETTGLADVGGDGWSRGLQLCTSKGEAVEPVMFLAPRTLSKAAPSGRKSPFDSSLNAVDMKHMPAETSSSSSSSSNDRPLVHHSAVPQCSSRQLATGNGNAADSACIASEAASGTTSGPDLSMSNLLFSTPASDAATSAISTVSRISVPKPNFSLEASQLSQDPLFSSTPAAVLSAVGHAEKRAAEAPAPAAKRPKPSAASTHSTQQITPRRVKLSYSLKPLVEESFSRDTGGPVVTVPLTLATVRTRFQAADAGEPQEEWPSAADGICPIGPLYPSGVYCVVEETRLSLFNQFRAKEMLMYQRLCNDHTLASQALEKPICITPEMMKDQQCWYRLCAMQRRAVDVSGTWEYDDPLLVKNGFCVRQETDERAYLTGVATEIPCYGYPDLVQLLATIVEIEKGGEGASVLSSRQPNVLTYLQSQVIRCCRQLPTSMDIDTLSSVIHRLGTHSREQWKCFHGKHVLQPVADLAESVAPADEN